MSEQAATAIAAGIAVASLLCVAATCAPPPSRPSPSAIWGELVDAGCAAADPDGGAYVAADLAGDASPAWMLCLADGGSVPGCGVPCK